MSSMRLHLAYCALIFAGGFAGCADEGKTGLRPGTGGDSANGGVSGNGGSPADNDAGVVPDAPTQNVKLKVAWWGSPDRDRRTSLVIQLFEAKYPHIDVIEEHYAATTSGGVGVSYWQTMDKHAQDKTLPDVMQHDHAFIGRWNDWGRLAPLDGFITDGTIKVDDIAPQQLRDGEFGGKIVGINLGHNTQSIVLDVDLFRKAAVPVPGDEWTWDEFEAAALQIKKNLNIWGFGPELYTPVVGWKSVYLSTGTWVFSPDNKSLAYPSDKPWNDHWQMVLRLLRAGAIPSLAEEPTSATFGTLPIITSKAAMELVFNSNQLVVLWNLAGSARNFKLLPLPRVKGGLSPIYLKPSQYFSVTATSAHPKEAALFIDYFVNSVEANLVLLGERGVPINSKVAGAIRPKLNRLEDEVFSLGERAQKYAIKIPPLDPPEGGTIYTQLFLLKVLEPIMAEVWTPEMATAIFRQEANAVLMGKPVPDGGAPDVRKPPEAGVAEPPRDAAVPTVPDARPLDAPAAPKG